MTLRKELPAFVSPMLARASEPFDSDHYLFELKWDGIRALVFRDRGGYRIRNRHGVDTPPAAIPSLPAAQVSSDQT